ncbi:MAG: hypothetical protein ACLRLX_01225, partial [Anaerovoracaceae bacterium]
FVLMSRRPGLAKAYFEDNIDNIYPADNIVLRGGILVRPPRYFDSMMEQIDEELMKDIKLKRVDIAEDIQKIKDGQTTADYKQQLQFAERNKESQLSKLVRPLE